ncbi:unnamed protein product [Blepharisma stoltei]|uniref:Uncharacterized protein n=1 Tax=Blepharisma stoltei TaxID=1481888 RepID=A0AAU9I854_9CILI|nr:unnamed protein product [Blepharisma stoltei]
MEAESRSLSQSSDSDNEFWDELDDKPQLTYKKLLSRRSTRFSEVLQFPKKEEPISPSKKEVTPILKKSETTPISKQEPIKIERKEEIPKDEAPPNQIKPPKQPKSDFLTSYKRPVPKPNYENDFSSLEVKELKMTLFVKEKTIKTLWMMLSELQFFITSNRLETDTTEINKNNIANEEENFRIQQFIEEIKKLNSQISILKDVCDIYQKDVDNTIKKMKEIENEKENLKESCEKEIEKLKIQFEEREKELLLEKEKITTELESYKTNVAKELEARDILENRQKNEVIALKEELKNAKTILQNPRLRAKVHEKLKEYMEENEKLIIEEDLKENGKISSKPPKLFCKPKQPPRPATVQLHKKAQSCDVSTSYDDGKIIGKLLTLSRPETPAIFPIHRRNASSVSSSYETKRKSSTPIIIL